MNLFLCFWCLPWKNETCSLVSGYWVDSHFGLSKTFGALESHGDHHHSPHSETNPNDVPNLISSCIVCFMSMFIHVVCCGYVGDLKIHIAFWSKVPLYRQKKQDDTLVFGENGEFLINSPLVCGFVGMVSWFPSCTRTPPNPCCPRSGALRRSFRIQGPLAAGGQLPTHCNRWHR